MQKPLTIPMILRDHYPLEHIKRKEAYEYRLNQIERIAPELLVKCVSTMKDKDLEDLRDRALKVLAPASVVSLLKFVSAMLRRVATRAPGNPRGLGFIEFHPCRTPDIHTSDSRNHGESGSKILPKSTPTAGVRDTLAPREYP